MEKTLFIINENQEIYQHKTPEFWRSGELKKAVGVTPTEFFRAVNYTRNNPKPPTKDQQINFNVGHFVELFAHNPQKAFDVLANTLTHGTDFCVFDPEKRPIKSADFRTKENKIWKDEIFQNDVSKNQRIIDYEDVNFIEKIQFNKTELAFIEKLRAPETLYQVAVYWTDEKTGIKLKTLCDFVRVSEKYTTIIDVKSTKAATSKEFLREINKNLYELQAQSQIEGIKASGKFDKEIQYFWLGFSKAEPYNVFIVKYELEGRPERQNSELFYQSVEMAAQFEASQGLILPQSEFIIY